MCRLELRKFSRSKEVGLRKKGVVRGPEEGSRHGAGQGGESKS